MSHRVDQEQVQKDSEPWIAGNVVRSQARALKGLSIFPQIFRPNSRIT